MSKQILAIFTIIVLAGGIFSSSAAFADSKVPVIILFKERVSEKHLDIVMSAGGEVTRKYNIIHGVAANIPSKALNGLKNNPNILAVDPDVNLMALDTVSTTQIRANHVWTTGNTGSGIKVAVLDTGIDQAHSEFSGRIANCVSMYGAGSSPGDQTCNDENGHGTHVAGILGAAGSVAAAKGVAPDYSIMAVKVLKKTGSGSLSAIIAGMDYAVANGAKVISMSLGTSPISTTQSNCDSTYPSLTTAVNNAVNSGVTVVAAAGNSGTSGVGAPACISGTIAVAAVDSSDVIASFSSKGGPVKDHGVAAPGVSIYSAYPTNSYSTLSGTSMATPQVSGVIALMLNANPSLTPAQIKTALFTTTCTTTTSPSCPTGSVPNTSYGYGRVDALRAVTSVTPVVPTVPAAPVLSTTGNTDNTIMISWSTPSNGGSAIISYTYQWSSDNFGSVSSGTVPFGTNSATISGLSSSTVYDIRVYATNGIGDSAYSNVITVTTSAPLPPPTVPGAPTGLLANAVSSSQINLSWTAPSDGGSPITGYKIERESPVGGGWSVLVSNTGSTSTTYSDTGLEPKTEYNYRVYAINSVGTGSASNEASVTTQALPPPTPILSVDSITSKIIAMGGNNKKIETTILIKDGNGNNVQGASVSISVNTPTKTFSGSGVTDSSGKAVITVGPTKEKTGTYNSCINNVSLSGYVFDGIKPCSSGPLSY